MRKLFLMCIIMFAIMHFFSAVTNGDPPRPSSAVLTQNRTGQLQIYNQPPRNPCPLEYIDVINGETQPSDLFVAGYAAGSADPQFFCQVGNSVGYGFIKERNVFGQALEYVCHIFVNPTKLRVETKNLRMIRKPGPGNQLIWASHWPKNAAGNFEYTELGGGNGVVSERAMRVEGGSSDEQNLFYGRCNFFSAGWFKRNVIMPGYIGKGSPRLTLWYADKNSNGEDISRTRVCGSGEQILVCKIA